MPVESDQLVASQRDVSNQPPEISGLTAEVTQTYPGGIVNIQSVVTGNAQKFTWTATGGSFLENGRGYCEWRAPREYGDYEIKLDVEDGKGGITEATVNISVAANNPPQITSFTADPASLQFAQRTVLTVIANDSDGDALQYKWEASDGSLSGVGNRVSWTSPSKNGDFRIRVTVIDGRNAETKQELIILVASPIQTQTIPLVKQESGTVSSDGNRDTSFYAVGDDSNNIGFRTFLSYNVMSLQGMEIKEAKLKFTDPKVMGNDVFDETTGVGGFQFIHQAYGSKLPKFDISGGGTIQRQEQCSDSRPPTDLDVTPELTADVENRLERFQIEASFTKHASNGNNMAQFVQWSDAVLQVTYNAK